MGLVVLNFSHPMTRDHLRQVERLAEQAVERVIMVPVQINQRQPLMPQVRWLAEQTQLSPGDWQTLPLVVNPPGLAVVASALLAELHGRIGHFPTVTHLRGNRSGAATVYEVAELVNLEAMRDDARVRRRPEQERDL